MEQRVSFGSIGLWLAISLAAGSAGGQVYVESGAGFNIFEGDYTVATNVPLCGDMSHGGDVFIEHDLELGGQLYLSGLLYVEGQGEEGGDADQYIYFYDEDSRTDEYLAWDNGQQLFELSDSLRLRGENNHTYIDVVDAERLIFGVDSPYFWFLADSDNSVDWAHFNWARNSAGNSQRLMHLSEENEGDLSIGGTLTTGHNFDLAETFWAVGNLAAGELVVVDPTNPDAVRLAAGANDRGLVGVVSSRPAVNLGGRVFSVDALRETWGEAVVEVYEQSTPRLEAVIYADHDELQAESMRLHSPASFEQYLLDQAADEAAPATVLQDTDEAGIAPHSPRRSLMDDPIERYEQAVSDHRQRVEDLMLQRFFGERFVSVALAGRVPVKASAAGGAISIGDPLTSSRLPGVAMKATQAGPVIGTAMEPLGRGEGTIQLLVHRGWYGGDQTLRVAKDPRSRQRVDARLVDLRAENARLSARISVLEELVRGLTPVPRVAVSTQTGSGS